MCSIVGPVPLKTINAVSLVTAAALFALALPLVFAAPRRRAAAFLAIFLALVGTNFLVPALRCWILPCYTDGLWVSLGRLTLALDPFFLLAFVLTYLGVNLRDHLTSVVGAVALASAGAAAAVLLLPLGSVLHVHAPVGLDWLQVLLITNLVVAYLASWVAALAAHRHAPTPALRQRARWLAIAVGIAVLPRMALLPWDLGFKAFVQFGPFSEIIRNAGLPQSSTAAFVTLLVGATTLAATYLLVRRGFPRRAGPDWDPVDVAGAFAGGLFLVTVSAAVLPLLFPQSAVPLYSGGSPGYGLRWLVFAGIVAHRMLAGEIVDFERLSSLYVPVAGGLLGGLAAAMAVAVLAVHRGFTSAETVVFSVAIGLGATIPAAAGARRLLRFLDRLVPNEPGLARRLTLYRAALETAWVNGAPNGRRRDGLERDRRAWGLSEEEARTLEHVVMESLQGEAEELRPGDELAPGFVVEEELGAGAEARVFRVRATESQARLVAKVLEQRGRPRDDERFLREVRALQTLAHPHVVRLVEVGLWRGRRVLFFEDRGLRSLREGLATKLSPKAAERIAGDLLAGLAAAHAKGMVHGDVKPDNVLLDQRGRAMLTDFGLAATVDAPKDLRPTVTNLDALTRLAGTLAYMAPEQARGEPSTMRSDVFAAGLVIFECLAGRPGRDLRGRSGYESLEIVARVGVDVTSLPPRWHDLMATALAADDAARFSDAEAFRDAFERVRTLTDSVA